MEKKKFNFTFSKLDMSDIYTSITLDGCPWKEFMVVEENEDGSNVVAYEKRNGELMYYVKNCDDIVDTLYDEVYEPTIEARVREDLLFHDLSNEEMQKWILVVVEIAEIEGVKCPQVTFLHNEEGASSEGLLILPDIRGDDFFSTVEMVVTIAHELRHEWQRVHHPEWLDDYVHIGKDADIDVYKNHISEIDAEAYARKLASYIFDVGLFGGEDDITKKLLSYAQNLDIDLSTDSCEYIGSLLKIEELRYLENEYDSDDEETLIEFMLEELIDRYSELQRIRHSDDWEKEIDNAIKNCEERFKEFGIYPDMLKK